MTTTTTTTTPRTTLVAIGDPFTGPKKQRKWNNLLSAMDVAVRPICRLLTWWGVCRHISPNRTVAAE